MNSNPKGQALLIQSAVYNGDMMSKIELMLYLRDVITLKKEINQCMQNINKRKKRINILEIEKRRRSIVVEPDILKPTGISALLPWKMRAYEKWIEAIPEREKKKKQLEQAEDERIALLQREYDELMDKDFEDLKRANILKDDYCKQLERQIVAPEYREDNILEMLLVYLFNNRAQTLTEALNLYHEEQHRNTMLYLAEEQRRQIDLARQEQKQLVLQQMQMQQEQMNRIAKMAEETRKAAKDAETFSKMNFIMNLYKEE